MKKKERQTRQLSPGISRSRRPKKGLNKLITFWVTEEEKQNIERAAATSGVSVSRFVMERALKSARNVLSEAKPRRPSKIKLPPNKPPSPPTL
jgi:uncharacterized protein (DUF1778 family)